MTGIKQKYQDLFFQTEQTVNRKKSGFRAAPFSPVVFLEYSQLNIVLLSIQPLNLKIIYAKESSLCFH